MSIVHAIVRDISGMFDILDISDARRVSDSTAFKPPTSIRGAAAPDGGMGAGAGADAEDGFVGIDCDEGWILLLDGSGCCSFALLPSASPAVSITGSFWPRSLPRLATPTPHVRVVLYPEHSRPSSRHWEQ